MQQPHNQPYQQPHEMRYVSGQFAGIDMSDFALARQRARRLSLFWVAAVLIVTGMVAAAAYTLGSNIAGLI